MISWRFANWFGRIIWILDRTRQGISFFRYFIDCIWNKYISFRIVSIEEEKIPKLTRVLQMLDAVQSKLGIVDHANSELADLEMETKPEDVLAEIERLQAIELGKK
jgi:hypothetical protein